MPRVEVEGDSGIDVEETKDNSEYEEKESASEGAVAVDGA